MLAQIDQSLVVIFVLLELIDYYPPWHKSLAKVISDQSQRDNRTESRNYPRCYAGSRNMTQSKTRLNHGINSGFILYRTRGVGSWVP